MQKLEMALAILSVKTGGWLEYRRLELVARRGERCNF
jgi:hypothetical protein